MLETLEQLQTNLFTAKVHYRLWEELQKRRDQKNVEIANAGFGTFIEYTRHAHFKSFIIELGKIIENRKDTFNLDRLLIDVTQGGKASKALLALTENFKFRTKAIRKGLFILRNEVEAHRSMNRSPTQSFKNAAISSNDIADFMKQTSILLNEIGQYYFKKQWLINEIEEGESINRLFLAMEKYADI
jgi:ribosomal protein S18